MSYASDHAGAYRAIAQAGSSLTVSRSAQGTETVSGTLGTPQASSIAMVALAKRNDPQRLRDLGMTLANVVTLLVAPTDYPLRAHTDEFVLPNDTLTWNGVAFTVRAVGPIVAPDGNVIVATLIASV